MVKRKETHHTLKEECRVFRATKLLHLQISFQQSGVDSKSRRPRLLPNT
jgi:hypothetical protein